VPTFLKYSCAFVLVPIVALLVACDKGTATVVDPAKADAMAHAALISPRDLPGTDWVVQENDKFDTPEAYPDTSACSQWKSFPAAAQQGVVARAQRGIQRMTPGQPFPLIVSQQIGIYPDSKKPSDLLKELRTLLNDGTFAGCLSDRYQRQVASGRASFVIATTSNPSTNSPNGGESYAAEFDFTGLFAIREELYFWTSGSHVNALIVVGGKDAISKEVVRTALQRARTSEIKAFAR
jgi:hypothetical protein